jgi:predicted component of type VI protein secretion system
MTISRTARVLAPEGVLVRELEGESVLLNLNSEVYFGLDETGTRMWKMLTTSESIQAAYHSLLEEYEVEPEKLYQDLENLIEELVAHGLAEVAGE